MLMQINFTPTIFYRLPVYIASRYAAYRNLKIHETGLRTHGDRSGASGHTDEFSVTHEEALISYKANPNFCSASFTECKHHAPSLNRKELLTVPCSSPIVPFKSFLYATISMQNNHHNIGEIPFESVPC